MAKGKLKSATRVAAPEATVWFESEPQAGEIVASTGGQAAKAIELTSEALSSIGSFSQSVIEETVKQSPELDIISLEFGIKITTELGAVIAKSAVEGHCKVIVTWKRK